MYLIPDMARTFHWEAPRCIGLERDVNPTSQFLTDEKEMAFLFGEQPAGASHGLFKIEQLIMPPNIKYYKY